MRHWPLLLLLVALAAPANAAKAPYTDWRFDVRRALKAGDLDQFAVLAKAKPDFARIWFYGRVYDLVTPGVRDEVKAEMRPRLERIAAVLAALEPPDALPTMMLDRASNDPDDLQKEAEAARELQGTLLRGAGAEASLPALFAAVENPVLVHPTFYNLFHRAEIAADRLGGDREKARIVALARRIAQGIALATGELGPWRALAAYQGSTKGVNLVGEQVIEERLGEALNAWLAGDLEGARRSMKEALRVARSARGASLYTALLMNGTAHAASWVGDTDAERATRTRVLQAVRPLQRPALVALVGDQIVRMHLRAGAVDDMLAYTRELRELGEPVTRSAPRLRTLALALAALRDAAATRAEGGALADAERVLTEAEALMELLVDDAAVRITTPSAQVAAVRRERQTLQGELRRVNGRLLERRGRFEKALEAYTSARDLFEGTLDDTVSAARAEVEMARVRLALGQPDAALELAKSVRGRIGGRLPAVRAENARIAGHARLARGDYAPAFAHANLGLQLLRDAGVHEQHAPLRARLHLLAAETLEAAGHAPEAKARLEFARTLQGNDLAVAHALALLHTEAGEFDAALNALEAVDGDEGRRVARVLRGCVLTRAGKLDDALAALRETQSLVLPHYREAQLTGRICTAAAHLAAGRDGNAEKALAPSRAVILQYPMPALAWRVHALDGDIDAARGRWAAAAEHWRIALAAYVDGGLDRPSRGASLGHRSLAAPQAPSRLVAELPEALVRAAKGAKAEEATTLHHAAIGASLWARSHAVAPADGELEAKHRPEQDVKWRAHLPRIRALRTVLADPAVIRQDRTAAIDALGKAVDAAREGAQSMRDQAPVWGDLLLPSPPDAQLLAAPKGETRLYTRFTADQGHLWLLRPGQPPAHYELPKPATVEKLLKKSRAVLAEPPEAWPEDPKRPKRVRDPNRADWRTLKAPVRKLLPFAGDKALMAELAKGRVVIVPDGPLLDFPIEALVLEAPPRKAKGAPPTFVGTQLDVRYRALAHQAGQPKSAATPRALFGPLGPAAGGCPAEDLCAAEEAQAMAGKIRGAFAGSPDALVDFSDTNAHRDGLRSAFAGHGVVLNVAPVDLQRGELLATPARPEAAYVRVGGLPFALRENAATAVAFARAHRPTAEGLAALFGPLRFAGTTRALFVHPRHVSDAELLGEVAAGMGSGKDLVEAARGLRMDAMKASVDPAKGGAATHHPFNWARLRIYEP